MNTLSQVGDFSLGSTTQSWPPPASIDLTALIICTWYHLLQHEVILQASTPPSSQWMPLLERWRRLGPEDSRCCVLLEGSD